MAAATGWDDVARCLGFNIQPEDGSADLLVHISAVERSDKGKRRATGSFPFPCKV